MTCRDFAEFLLEYVEGELPAETRRRFDEHMAICPDCVHYLQHYTETIEGRGGWPWPTSCRPTFPTTW